MMIHQTILLAMIWIMALTELSGQVVMDSKNPPKVHPVFCSYDCLEDNYCDVALKLCLPCSELCLIEKRTERCQELCPEFSSKHLPTVEPSPQTVKPTQDDGKTIPIVVSSAACLVILAVAVLLVCFCKTPKYMSKIISILFCVQCNIKTTGDNEADLNKNEKTLLPSPSRPISVMNSDTAKDVLLANKPSLNADHSIDASGEVFYSRIFGSSLNMLAKCVPNLYGKNKGRLKSIESAPVQATAEREVWNSDNNSYTSPCVSAAYHQPVEHEIGFVADVREENEVEQVSTNLRESVGSCISEDSSATEDALHQHDFATSMSGASEAVVNVSVNVSPALPPTQNPSQSDSQPFLESPENHTRLPPAPNNDHCEFMVPKSDSPPTALAGSLSNRLASLTAITGSLVGKPTPTVARTVSVYSAHNTADTNPKQFHHPEQHYLSSSDTTVNKSYMADDHNEDGTSVKHVLDAKPGQKAFEAAAVVAANDVTGDQERQSLLQEREDSIAKLPVDDANGRHSLAISGYSDTSLCSNNLAASDHLDGPLLLAADQPVLMPGDYHENVYLSRAMSDGQSSNIAVQNHCSIGSSSGHNSLLSNDISIDFSQVSEDLCIARQPQSYNGMDHEALPRFEPPVPHQVIPNQQAQYADVRNDSLQGAVGGIVGNLDEAQLLPDDAPPRSLPDDVQLRSYDSDSGAGSIIDPFFNGRSGYHELHHNNNYVYEQLQNIPWVLGYHSAGRSISIYADLDLADPEELRDQLCDVTHQAPDKFRIKSNAEYG